MWKSRHTITSVLQVIGDTASSSVMFNFWEVIRLRSTYSVCGSLILWYVQLCLPELTYRGNILNQSCHLARSTSSDEGLCGVLYLLLHCFAFCRFWCAFFFFNKQTIKSQNQTEPAHIVQSTGIIFTFFLIHVIILFNLLALPKSKQHKKR